MVTISHILCFGAGDVGGPTMAMIAAEPPHLEVTVVKVNEARIAVWNSGELPIDEPGLDAMVRSARGPYLFFCTDIDRKTARFRRLTATRKPPPTSTGPACER